MSRRTKVWLGIGVVVLLLAALRLKGGGDRAVEVREEKVGTRDLVAAVTASGSIEAKSQVDISSEVTARITRLHVKEGDMVRKGDLLVELDQAQFKGAVERAQASLAAAKASSVQADVNRAQAKRSYDRQTELKKATPALISDESVEQANQAWQVSEALFRSAQASVQQAQAALKEAQDNLARTMIYSPIAGQVVRLPKEEGEVAVPSTFSAEAGLLMRIADLSVIQAKVKVDETDVVRLNLRDSVSVSIDALPDTTFVGRVTKIANSAATTSATGQANDRAVDFEVEVTLANPPKNVRPDLSMTARIITDVRKNVLSVPIIALTARSQAELSADAPKATPLEVVPGTDTTGRKKPKEIEGVFVVENGLAVFRPVKVGIAGDEYFEVLSGLKAGETVVAGTYQTIRDMKDSTRVKPMPTTEVKKP